MQLIGNELTRIENTIGFEHKKSEKLKPIKKGKKKKKKGNGGGCC